MVLQSPAPNRPPRGACGARATIRQRARHAAERWLARSPLPTLLNGGRATAVILAYHNVVPAGGEPCGDRSLHLRQEVFAAQLDLLARAFNVMPLNELSSTSRHRRRVAVTFDDGYRGAVTAGVEELARRGLPATVFVVAGAAAGERFWWDRLAGAAGLDPALRARALDLHGGRPEAVLAAFGAGGWPSAAGALSQGARAGAEGTAIRGTPAEALPAHAAAASDAELRAAAAVPGIALGSHGATHADLTALAPGALRDELAGSLASLRRRFGGVLAWISYPYGRVSPAVVAAARAAGYEGGVRVEGGALRRGDDPLSLPRINVPAGVTVDGFALRARGMEMGRWRASW